MDNTPQWKIRLLAVLPYPLAIVTIVCTEMLGRAILAVLPYIAFALLLFAVGVGLLFATMVVSEITGMDYFGSGLLVVCVAMGGFFGGIQLVATKRYFAEKIRQEMWKLPPRKGNME